MARPKLDIDPEQVEKLASKLWKNTEIAAFFGCDEGTIRKRFSDILQKGREIGKTKLRDRQMQAAMDGNVTMLIWLGKQYLGQSDKVDQKIESAAIVQRMRRTEEEDEKFMRRLAEVQEKVRLKIKRKQELRQRG